ncbi:Wall associated protein [Bacillus cereus m1550]|nr:Wall associated protein [Bacillus cereus m1550]
MSQVQQIAEAEKLTGHITTKQTVTQGGYTNKVSYDYNTLDQNIRVTDGSQTYRFDYDD